MVLGRGLRFPTYRGATVETSIGRCLSATMSRGSDARLSIYLVSILFLSLFIDLKAFNKISNRLLIGLDWFCFLLFVFLY